MRIFITGASSGIGAALARYYGKRGDTLGLLARRETELREVGQSTGSTFEIYPCDILDLVAVKTAANHFIATHGLPDVVIANAGISFGTLTGTAEDVRTFGEILSVNVMGMVHAFHPFIDPMRSRRSGKLVGIASVAGYRGLPGAGGYSASKAAAISYLESLRVELRGRVRVITVCPGYIATPMTARNPFPMPFLLEVDRAAGLIARVIDAGRSYAVIPWQMAIVARLLRLVPNVLFDRLVWRTRRKPRKR